MSCGPGLHARVGLGHAPARSRIKLSHARAARFAASANLHALLSGMPATAGHLGMGPETTIDRRRAIELDHTGGCIEKASIELASVDNPHPLAVVERDRHGGQITLVNWNRAAAIQAHPPVIAAGQ